MGHPEQALADVRRADARSREIASPDGISQLLQISANSGEPFASRPARNLLSKDDWRAAEIDKRVNSGPEVSLVGMAELLSCARKRLTGKARGPARAVPSGEVEGVFPSGDPGEEMHSLVAAELVGANVEDGSVTDMTRRDQPRVDQVA